MAWLPKVNRHVDYLDAAGKLRPATITNVVSSTVLDLRIVRSGETHLAVPIQTARGNSSVWRRSDKFIGAAAVVSSDLLMETGDVLLTEAGDRVLLEA